MLRISNCSKLVRLCAEKCRNPSMIRINFCRELVSVEGLKYGYIWKCGRFVENSGFVVVDDCGFGMGKLVCGGIIVLLLGWGIRCAVLRKFN